MADETQEVIYSYTSKEAIDDGILVDISQHSKFVTIATRNLLESKGYITKDELNIPNLKDLVAQCMKIMTKSKPDWFYSGLIEFPDGSKGKVFIAQNETGKYTAMLPEDY